MTEKGRWAGRLRRALWALRAGVFANLGLKLVALALALLLYALFGRRAPEAETPAPAGPPACMCPCPCTPDGHAGRLPAPSGGSTLPSP